MRLHPRDSRSNERGSILIWVALFMIVMLAFVALGVDGAKLMATRTQLQNAADAGALAGASEVDPGTGLIDQAKARSTAQATAANNKAFIGGPMPVIVPDADVSFPTPSQCKVDVTRSGPTAIVTHIAQVVGVKALNSEATATAGLSKPDCVFGVRPLGVGNSTLPFQYVAGQQYALIDGFASGNYQHLDFSQMEPPLDPPCTSGPCAGMSSQGGALLKCMILHGLGCCISQDTYIRVQTGVSSGNVKSAVDALFDADTDDTEYLSATTDAYDTYEPIGNGSRVIIVPLVEFVKSPTDPSPCVGGNNCWGKVNGYAAFFLKRRYTNGQKTFYGEFIEYKVSGEGEGGNGTVYSIKLVN
jgi:hypothetical protein